jgi:general secretion pathway protein J
MLARTHRSERGFTLIELLLAMSLVAFIMLMAYSGLQGSMKLADAGEAMIDRSSRARLTHEFLRKQIARMLPLVIRQDGGKNVLFEGEENRMMWVGPMPGYLGKGGPYVQELSLDRESDGTVLNYRFAMLNGYEDGDLDEEEPVALIEGIARAEFGFRTVDNTGKVEDWSKSWETKDAQNLPLMVKLALTMRPETRMKIPELVVTVVVDGNVQRTAPNFTNFTGVQQ